MRVLYFGTYQRDYPRNAQVISCLRGAGVEVVERRISVWDRRRDGWRVGAIDAGRLALAELRLLARPGDRFDAIIVGYPGHLDLTAARRAARGAPVVFNPLVSLSDTLLDRGLAKPGSPLTRAVRTVDRHSLRAADLVVADTEAHAAFLAELAGLPPERVAVCLVGAEERVFRPVWQRTEPFRALFVGKLIPLHGLETILDAAYLAPEISFRIVGSGQLDALLRHMPANVEHVAWIEYEQLSAQLGRAGCALGIFGMSAKAQRVIPNKAFQALACGTPLVTGDTPAAQELLADGDSALLVPPGDAEALATAIRRIASDAALAEHLSAGGLHAYRERASEEVLGRRWRGLLERLM